MIGIEVYETEARLGDVDPQPEWRFRVRARNGEIVASSEGYTTKAAAEKGIRALRRALLPGTRDAETLAKAWREGADHTNGYEKEYTAEELDADNPYLQEVPTPPRMRFDHYGARDDDENPMCGCGYKPETRTPDFAVELVAAHIRKETR